MSERAEKWQPIADIYDGFNSISLSLSVGDDRRVEVVLHGARNLSLGFSGVVALNFEDDCPGNFPHPKDLPMLEEHKTFPLLRIEGSQWLAQWPMYSNRRHYFLISADDLLHLVAKAQVNVAWI